MTDTRRPAPGDHRPASFAAARSGREVARGASALAALLVSLAGVPWLLATLGGNPLPDGLPSLSEIADTLARPDDGSLFLEALLLLGWAGWVAFALSVAVEVPAQLRGRSAPRLPALGASQRAAGALVAAVAVLLVSSALSSAPTEAPGLSTVAAGTSHRPPATAGDHLGAGSPAPSLTPVEQANETATPDQHPTYRVHRQDTLWAIAERCLGAGERFSEIADLNYGVAQADGRALTSSHWINPGWVLRLPRDARVDTRSGDGRSDPAGRDDNDEYTVRPGDTLWDIAAAELGLADRYDEIAALNAGHPQPDGQRLRDPDHIEPGWQLQLPTTSPRRTAASEENRTTTSAPGRDAGRDEPATPDPAATPTAAFPPTDPTAPGLRADDQGPTDRADEDRIGHGGDQDEHDEAEGLVPAKVGLGLAGITAAALLAALARRRALQQRARPLGRRIALADAAAQAVEARLRAADDRETLGQLRAALLLLAAHCADVGRDLPALGAVRVTRTDIELHLLQQEPDPVEPFTAVTGDRWRADLSDFPTSHGDGTAGGDEVPFPYPALLTVDATDDSTLLVDLEAAGTLTAVGTPDDVRAVLNAWAVELAAAPAWDTVGVTLVGSGWPPAAVDAARVRLLDSPATAARRAAVRTRDVTAILDAAHTGTVREARSRGVAPDVWDPEVVLLGPHPDDHPASPIELMDAGGTGVAVVTSAPTAESAPPGWTVTATGGGYFQLDPLRMTVTPPRLEDQHLVSVTAALEVAHEEAGVDPPAQPAVSEAADIRADTSPDPAPDEQGVADGEPEQHDENPQTGPPQILVLGPVEVWFTSGEDADSARRRKLTELAAFIALHPGADNHGIDDAIWPARRASPSTRNSATSRLRRWLGAGPEGDPWLPVVPDRGQYRFRPDVGCDWHDFQALTRRGLAGGPKGLEHLAAALALVRGRPFTGVDPAWYTWAEYDTQEMISAVTDVAHMLSKARLAAGDPERARDAAARGLLVEPCSELLTQDAIRAATALGDWAAAERLVERLRTRLSAIDPDADVHVDTVELARRLART